MNASGEWGVVAIGRRADLLPLDGNPIEDVRHAARRVGVMVRGQRLEELASGFAAATNETPARQ